MNDNTAHLGSTQISLPLILGLSEKLDFEVANIFNFTIMPLDEQVVFAWNEHEHETGEHPLIMEAMDYDEFNDIAESAMQAIIDSGAVSAAAIANAMEHVEILDELGASMHEYPIVAAYLNQYYPGLLEFTDEDARGALTEAFNKVRGGWLPE